MSVVTEEHVVTLDFPNDHEARGRCTCGLTWLQGYMLGASQRALDIVAYLAASHQKEAHR
jgi:hypothetical protein